MIGAAGNRNPRRVWLRLTLLLCVMCGVGAMHTLGHPTTHHSAGSHTPTHEAAPAASVGPGTHAAADDSGGHAADTADQTELPPLDPTSMCLALAGLLLMLAGIVSSAFHRWPGMLAGRPPPAPTGHAYLGRPLDPPSLSRLQVLRV